mmetsp:Transcript_12088/g.18551  ORF Transcript_12088/g.18551 Transcript_12088/m.18551 type:complete len:111 (+) Transcript_12088:86-418(+)
MIPIFIITLLFTCSLYIHLEKFGYKTSTPINIPRTDMKYLFTELEEVGAVSASPCGVGGGTGTVRVLSVGGEATSPSVVVIGVDVTGLLVVGAGVGSNVALTPPSHPQIS